MSNLDGVSQKIHLTIPADKTYVPVASLAVSGLGMALGMELDLLGDLRTVIAECMDCLLSQAGRPRSIEMAAGLADGRLCISLCAQQRSLEQQEDMLSLEITRGVLETLMPEVALDVDEHGVRGIECSMPV